MFASFEEVAAMVAVLAGGDQWTDEVVDHDTDRGGWLVAHRWEMDRGESSWLEALAVFDRDQGWAADGQLSCVEWLMWRTAMARATAFQKLRIARQLSCRPVVAEAFADGRLSYSAVRAITRIDDVDAGVDAALVDLAVAGTVADVERAVRCYQLHADQHRAPGDATERRGLRIIRGYDGTGRVEITLTTLEIEEFAAALQAFLDDHHRPVESPAEDSAAADPDGSPGRVGESSAEDSAAVVVGPGGPGRRADAFMDMVGVALAGADGGHAAGADRYLVHLVTHDEGTDLVDGTPLDTATAARVGCDASQVSHRIGIDGEPLALGRKTRVWSTAQRRAATVRDGGHCRFPGCQRRIADLHHQQPWAAGGSTDLENGFLACPRHHTLLHDGFRTTGNPNNRLNFYRPDSIFIGVTTARRR
ncbi:MAG: HNH endonuclease [Actinomycetota bacterium]|nr:HNH endonuclease [Actinomycetota bacterium]